MASRSAIDTIKGYFYQFDLSVEKLLTLPKDDDYIEVEKIEDIDVSSATETTAVQCEYYAKTEYNHSVIAKPIRLMIQHYKLLKNNSHPLVRYKIYGYYKSGQNKLTWPIGINDFKDQFLTYTKDKETSHYFEEIGATDVEIQEFITLLDININAKSYDEQLQSILISLQRTFRCSEFEAQHYYYNNALKIIKELAVNNDATKRRISKAEFISAIDKKEILFNSWFIQLKGEIDYCKNIKKQYFQTPGLSTSPFERIFAFETTDQDHVAEIKHIVLHIQKKWSKLSKRDLDASFCPYVYIHGASESRLLELKKSLRDGGIRLIDGTEFAGDDFKPESISRKATYYNEIKIKFINEIEHIYETLSHIKKTSELYQFYINEPFLDFTNPTVLHIKIQLPRLNYLKEIC